MLKDLHYSPVRCLRFVHQLDLVISTDESGMIELWDPETFEFPSSTNVLKYELITDTDFFDLAKVHTMALAMAVSNNGNLLAVYGRDKKVRVFDIKTGKLLQFTVESNQVYIDYQATKGTAG